MTRSGTCFAQVSRSTFLRAAMTEKSERSTNEIIFSGKKVEDWFKFDRQVFRAVRKKFGSVGVKLWSETLQEQ